MTSTTKPRSIFRQRLPILVQALLIVYGVTPWVMVAAFNILPALVLLALPSLIPMLMITVVVHEFGHLAAALLMGLRIQQIAIKPLQLVRVGQKFRLRFFFSRNDGQVTAYPLDANRVRQRMAVFIAGGPVANLLAALTCLVLAWCLDWKSPPLFPRAPLSFWLDFAGLTNLVYSLGNMVPGGTGKLPSDGSRLIAFWENPLLAERAVLLYAAQAEMLNGTSTKWGASLVERMLKPKR
jgi:peptidase M50-like protein